MNAQKSFPNSPITPADIDAGIRRAHELRSRAYHDSFARVIERFERRPRLRLPIVIGGAD